MTWYNENDPVACTVLRHCYDGVVCERSIKDVRPGDLDDYHCRRHWFAGAGLWEVACRLARWPAERELWTASCPCQPFSCAGKGAGENDPRHLWPDLFRLVRECRPATLVGEQVANAAGPVTYIDENLRHMWNAKDLDGFLSSNEQSRQFKWLSCEMQGMLKDLAEEVSRWLEDAEVGYFQTMEKQESSFGSDRFGQTPSQNRFVGIRPGSIHTSNTSTYRQEQMRDVWNPISIGRGENVGQPVFRPDQPETWLRDHERQSGALRTQRDDEYLGSRYDFGYCRSGKNEKTGDREPSPGEMGSASEGKTGGNWLDGVRSDLESIGYSFRSVDIPACAVDAPHRRNRIYWIAVADADGSRRREFPASKHAERSATLATQRQDDGSMADADGGGHRGWQEDAQRSAQRRDAAEWAAMGDPGSEGLALGPVEADQRGTLRNEGSAAGAPDHRSFWMDAEWLQCADGKARRAKPGIRLLVNGMVGRTDLWRLAGNSIVPQLAAQVLAALMEVT